MALVMENGGSSVELWWRFEAGVAAKSSFTMRGEVAGPSTKQIRQLVEIAPNL